MSRRKRSKYKRGQHGAYRHGAYSIIHRGGNIAAIPDNRKYIRLYLEEARDRMIAELGPTEEELTQAQIILINGVISKLGIIRLVEEYVREKGIFMKGGQLHSILAKQYLAWTNSMRADLQLLGINRRKIEPEWTPAELAEAINVETTERETREKAEAHPGADSSGENDDK